MTIMASLSSQTQAIYRRHLLELARFTQGMAEGWEFLPCKPDVLVLYVQELFQSDMAAASIRSRVAAIAFWHRLCRLADPSQDWLVKRALLGVSKLRPQADHRHPVSVSNVQALVDAAANVPHAYDALLLRALFAAMFFLFLRVGEVTGSVHNLAFEQFKFYTDKVTVAFESFKASKGRTPVVCAMKQAGSLCPHRLLSQYRAVRGSGSGPFFRDKMGQPLTAAWFNAHLAVCVAQAKLVHLPITSHSFRIGAATWAVEHGHSIEQLKRMGRWHSDAVLRYVRIPTIQVGGIKSHTEQPE